jgi:hypothetical protein
VSAQVYIVESAVDYEKDLQIAAFLDRALADAFVVELNRYQETREPMPDNDDGYEAWSVRDDEWRARHPAGHDGIGDGNFRVYPLELRG